MFECLRPTLTLVLLAGLTGVAFSKHASAEAQSGDASPGEPSELRVFVLRPEALALAKERIAQGDGPTKAALESLVQDADGLLDTPPPSVMDKPDAPPSGDKHDYMSLAPYWWPDPDKSDGLPYIRRDGEVNPERSKYDVKGKGVMTGAIPKLALAYHFTGDERYAKKAADFFRVWFLDAATRMNPNLNFAQAVPGRSQGRCYGIIDMTSWCSLIDAAGLIEPSDAWTPEDREALQGWFREFLDWLLTSKLGKQEGATKNNHATWYAVQVATYALFAGEMDTAREAIGRAQSFIAHHVEPSGEQPAETARTKGLSYSDYNLRGLLYAARLGEHLGMDLWTYATEDGRSIRKALDFLIPYALGEKEWTRKQISPWHISPEILHLAARGFQDPAYAELARRLGEKSSKGQDRVLLTDPLP